MNNIIPGHCLIRVYENKGDLEYALTCFSTDSAVKERISTTVFSSEHTDLEFTRTIIENFGDVRMVSSSRLSFKNVKHLSFEEICSDIRACAGAGCKLVILIGECVRNIPGYDALAEELGISMLALAIKQHIK